MTKIQKMPSFLTIVKNCKTINLYLIKVIWPFTLQFFVIDTLFIFFYIKKTQRAYSRTYTFQLTINCDVTLESLYCSSFVHVSIICFSISVLFLHFRFNQTLCLPSKPLDYPLWYHLLFHLDTTLWVYLFFTWNIFFDVMYSV